MQGGNQRGAAGGVGPMVAEIVHSADFPQQAFRQLRLVLGNRHGGQRAVHIGHHIAAGVSDANLKAGCADDLLRFGGRPAAVVAAIAAAGPLRKILAQQPGGVGVVVDAEQQLVAGNVNAGAAPQHLMKQNRAFQVAEKDDIADGRHIHAGSQQVHGSGDKVAGGRPAKVGQLCVAVGGGGTLESVGIPPLPTLSVAPVGVKVVHCDRDIIGVVVAGTKDDGFLLRPAGGQQIAE